MKIRFAAVAVAACVVSAGAVQAQIFVPGPYAVINYSGLLPNFKSAPYVHTPSYLDGGELDVGWRFNRYYSVEASYAYDTGNNNSNGTSLTTNFQTAAIDGLGYLPLGRNTPWALFADAGATVIFAHDLTSLLPGGNETRFGGRAGGGVLYQIDDNLGVRLSGRYEWTGLADMRSAAIFGVGVVWQR